MSALITLVFKHHPALPATGNRNRTPRILPRTFCCKSRGGPHLRWGQHPADSCATASEGSQCLFTGQGVQPKPHQGTFSQVMKDPFSFPKAEGASTVIDLGMKSQD